MNTPRSKSRPAAQVELLAIPERETINERDTMSAAIVPISTSEVNHEQIQTVNARDLHGFLEIGKDFSTWIKGRVSQYGFSENQDYVIVKSIPRNGGTVIDYYVTLDMAKELSMVERNEKGKQARQYFIACEKKANTPVATVELPKDAAGLARMLAEYAGKYADEYDARMLAEAKIEQDKPLVSFAKQIAMSDSCIKIGDFAKLLCDKGVKVGQNRMFKWFRDNKYLFKDHDGNNKPYQQYLDMELFECTETMINRTKGAVVKITTRLTGKGQAYFAKKAINAFGTGTMDGGLA